MTSDPAGVHAFQPITAHGALLTLSVPSLDVALYSCGVLGNDITDPLHPVLSSANFNSDQPISLAR